MTRRIFLAPHHSTEELERRYKAADGGIERSHLQIIWLLSQGHAAKFVAAVTGYSSVWVSTILWRYNDHGLAGLATAGWTIPVPPRCLSRPRWRRCATWSASRRPTAGRAQGGTLDHRAEHRVAPARCRIPASP